MLSLIWNRIDLFLLFILYKICHEATITKSFVYQWYEENILEGYKEYLLKQ